MCAPLILYTLIAVIAFVVQIVSYATTDEEQDTGAMILGIGIYAVIATVIGVVLFMQCRACNYKTAWVIFGILLFLFVVFIIVIVVFYAVIFSSVASIASSVSAKQGGLQDKLYE